MRRGEVGATADNETNNPTNTLKDMTMNLSKWDPVRELRDVAERFNRALGHRYTTTENGDKEALTRADWSPSVDITEDDANYLIEVELPGVEKEGVKVAVENEVLTIRGERKFEREETGAKVHRVERSFGSFLRTFRVPEDADGEAVAASFKNGVLTVTLPKTEKAKPRQIEVQVD